MLGRGGRTGLNCKTQHMWATVGQRGAPSKAAACCQNSKSDFYKNLVEKKSATLSVATHYGTSAPLQS